MSTRTLTALYNQKPDAERAREDLKSAGVSGANVDIHEQSQSGGAATGGDTGFMGKLRGFFGGHDDADTYAEGLRRGHYLLTAKVDDGQANEAVRILEASNAVDFDQSEQAWRSEGWNAASTAADPFNASQTGLIGAATGMAAAPTTGVNAGFDKTRADQSDQVIPIVQEQLQVGKREVERGGVRVRSYVVETPVSEQIGLREEHVSVERRAVNQPTNNADALFQNRDIELTETAEEAVVAKEAFVREELRVRKDVGERVEEINDSVRHTEVEVEDTTRPAQAGVTTPRSI